MEDQTSEEQKYSIEHLNRLYQESETADRDVFAEMRSNILMMSGQHWKKISNGIHRNLTNLKVDQSKRLRLTQNHTAKGVGDIVDLLSTMVPGVLPYPKRESERSDQKTAEISKAVWEDGRNKNNWEEQADLYVNCFASVGEVCSKVYFDPIKGGLKAYQQKVTEDGQPVYVSPEGEETVLTEEMMLQGVDPQALGLKEAADKSKPVFKGIVTIEKFEPYNLLRHKNCKSIRTSKFLIYRKSTELEEMKALIKNSNLSDEEKSERLDAIKKSSETAYKIFDGTTGSFQDSEGQVLIREFYFRQSPEFPRGQYFICCESMILFSGDIPFGEFGEVAFPIKWAGYDLYEGSARGFSPIKRARPAQIEINRCASSTAESQATFGWDRLILSKNSKVSRGISISGMQTIHTTDASPTVVPGRDGSQFVGWMDKNVDTLYMMLKIPENAQGLGQVTDPKAELFKKQRQKGRFTQPAGRLARFYKDICETYLFLSQKYMSDDDVIEAVGKKEAINVAEFKNLDRLDMSVKLMEIQDDMDSMAAKSIELETIVQYMGKNLDPESSKILLTQFPILNKAQAFKHLTIDLDNVNSDLLALDRGEQRPANRYDEHALYVKHIIHRMKQRDFELLPPNVQQAYAVRLEEHQNFMTEIAKQEQEAAAGFVPSGGFLAKCDVYWNPDPSNPTKQERLTLPSETIMWAKRRLDSQGSTQELLQTVGNETASAEMMTQMSNPQIAGGPQSLMPGQGQAQAQAPNEVPFDLQAGQGMAQPPVMQGAF